MATRQQHYQASERLLEYIAADDSGTVYDEIAAAQVHATLALAAATAATAPAEHVTAEPAPGAVVEVGGVRYFNQPGRSDDTIPWVAYPPVTTSDSIPIHWHDWASVLARGPVRLLLAAPQDGA